MNTRRLLIILSIIALLIIVGVGFYFIFSGSKTPASPTGTQTGTGSLPNAGDQTNAGSGGTTTTTSSTNTTLAKNFGVISTNPTLDYFVDAANTVTAIEPDGTIIQVVNGHAATISSIVMQNIINASFSYNGAKILVSFGDPTNPQTSVFDIAAKAWTPLKQGLLSPAWSPSDYRIAYLTNNTNGTESFATVDASKLNPAPILITGLHAQDLAVTWAAKNELVFYTKPSSFVPGSAWLFDLQKTTLTPIALEAPGLALLWSGPAFVRSIAAQALEFTSGASGLGGSLALMDQSGNITQRLRFLTLPSKCSFAVATSTANPSSTPYLFCGVPRDQDIFSTSNLPDSYNQLSLYTSDDIYRIGLQSGAVDTVFNDQTQNLDVSDVKFFNNMLFFINRYDQKLYTISL
jgi:hypothetical protein